MKRILWGLLILLVLLVGGCGYKQSISDADATDGTTTGAPAVSGYISYTVPNNGDTGIINNSKIYIVFNQSVNEQTATNASYFPVVCGTISEAVKVVYSATSKTLEITPTDGAWTDSSLCKVTVIGTSLRNSSGGILGSSDYSFSFTTASGTSGSVPVDTPLAVDFTVPIDNATGVTVTDPFTLFFNKALNPLTVTTTSFITECGSTSTKTPLADFSVEYSSANKAVVVKPPSAGWPGDQVCTVTARKSYLKDSANVPLGSDQSFTFSTGTGAVGASALAVDYAIPIPPVSNIAVNTELTFVFNKELNFITVVPTAFSAICDGNEVKDYKVTYVTANKSVKLTPPSSGWGNGASCVITIKKDSLWAADKLDMTADYIYNFSTITTSGVPVSRLALSSDKYSVKSTGTDQATLTVKALDANGATIRDVNITLSTDRGELSTSNVTTDETGEATFTFNADTTRANGVAMITAKSGLVTPVSLPMTIAGTTLTLTADKSVTKTGLADDITLSGSFKDADNRAIALSEVVITSSLGNTLKDKSTGVSGPSITVKSDGFGIFALTYSAVNVGTDTITATGFGATGIATLTVTNSTFSFIDPLPNAVVDTNATQTLTVHWTNDLGLNEVGKTVTFSATNGTFDDGVTKSKSLPIDTNASGNAIVTYTASGIASPDTITATATTATGAFLQTVLPLDIRANNPTQFYIQASSTVIAIKTPGSTPTSTIIATVLDPTGNPVAGQIVDFTLVAGAGGGEYLSPPSAVTDSAGQAKTTFYAGTASSLQNGVVVQGSIDRVLLADLTDTVNLTISGAAASIIFGTTNKIGAITIDGYPVAYELPVSVLVTDINGAPIKDRAISIGIYPTQFRTGLYSESGGYSTTARFENEDRNRNAILDAGEDGALGFCLSGSFLTCSTGSTVYYHNGSEGQRADMLTVKTSSALNGRLDPRNVATAPMEVITDASGLALIKIVYPKSYCNWVNIELAATTQVSGTETRAHYNTNLACMADDDPYSSSPFGY